MAAGVSSPQRRRGLLSTADVATQARFAPPSRRSRSSWPSRMSGRRPRRSSPSPHPLSAMRPSNRSGGRPVSRGPVSHDRCDPGVRTDRRLVPQPRCPHRAGFRTSVRWDRPRLAQRVRHAAVVGERLGRRTRIGPGGEGMVERWPGGWHQCRRQTWAAAWHARRLRRRARRMADRGAGPPQVPVDWLGVGKEQLLPRPPHARPGQVAGVMGDRGAGPGDGDHAAWSLR
jgi:hypothetical protein